jgi:spermidine/putrescine transport system substrate-binding protein
MCDNATPPQSSNLQIFKFSNLEIDLYNSQKYFTFVYVIINKPNKSKRKNMKRIILLTCALATAGVGLQSCSSGVDERSKKLQIVRLVNFIDPTIVAEFEAEYAKESGIKDFKVEQIDVFKVADGITKYPDADILNTLDYRIPLLVERELIQPLDHSQLPPLEGFYDFLLNNYYDVGNRYSIPYSYGTVGILYNPTHAGVDRESMRSWAALWNPKYKGKLVLIDRIHHEDYMMGVLYTMREKLQHESANFTYPSNYRMTLTNLTTDLTVPQVAQVSYALGEQVSLLVGGKHMQLPEAEARMADNDSVCGLGLFHSCRSFLLMRQNPNLEYSYPREGTNIHTFNWTIGKNCANTKAAYAFLRFISRPENAKRNIDYIGTPSAVRQASQEYYDELASDSNPFWADKTPAWKAMLLDNFIPGEETLKRCYLYNLSPEKIELMNAVFDRLGNTSAASDAAAAPE